MKSLLELKYDDLLRLSKWLASVLPGYRVPKTARPGNTFLALFCSCKAAVQHLAHHKALDQMPENFQDMVELLLADETIEVKILMPERTIMISNEHAAWLDDAVSCLNQSMHQLGQVRAVNIDDQTFHAVGQSYDFIKKALVHFVAFRRFFSTDQQSD